MNMSTAERRAAVKTRTAMRTSGEATFLEREMWG
jgi:hypothetical protein